MSSPFLLVLCLVPWVATSAWAAAPADQPLTELAASSTDTAAFPARIDAIVVHGLTRTHVAVVLRELPFRPGDRVTQDVWNFAILRLWNLNLFATIHGRTELDRHHHRRTAVFDVTERWTLIPLFAFGFGGGVGFVQGGLAETNLAGRFLTVGARYERFAAFNGFQAWVRDPRMASGQWDGLLIAEQLVRPRPDYGDRRLRFAAELARTGWQDRLRASWRLTLQRNTQIPRDGSDVGPAAPEVWSRQAELGVRLGRIDTVRMRETGAAAELRAAINAYDPDFSRLYGALWLEAQAYWMPGRRWNVAGRLQAAMQGAAPVPLRLYLGGLDLVRGYPDSAVRTDRYVVLNAEARFIAWETKWLALMPAVFVDVGVTRREDSVVQPLLSTGGGVRVLFPFLVESGIRVDVAVPLLADACPAGCAYLSIGVYQFFDGILTPDRR